MLADDVLLNEIRTRRLIELDLNVKRRCRNKLVNLARTAEMMLELSQMTRIFVLKRTMDAEISGWTDENTSNS